MKYDNEVKVIRKPPKKNISKNERSVGHGWWRASK
jgi:hypothetical protein